MEMYFREVSWNTLSASFYVRKWQMWSTLPAQHVHPTCLRFLQMATENCTDFYTLKGNARCTLHGFTAQLTLQLVTVGLLQ